MSGRYYKYDEDGNPVEVDDVLEWGRWYTRERRRVARDIVGIYEVSTVFLGIDHGWGDGPPVLWETMIFTSQPDELDQFQQRYTSLSEAAHTHEVIVQGLREEEDGV